MATGRQERNAFFVELRAPGIRIRRRTDARDFLLGSLLLRQGQRQRGRRAMETVVNLLGELPGDEMVAGSDGLTAGRLGEMAWAYLESS
jgi:hypothetical protein